MAFLQPAANRGSIATGFDISNSAKFEKDNSEWVHKTFAADPSGNGRRISTVSMWVKRTEIGSAGISSIASWYPASGTANNNTVYQMGFTDDDEFQIGLQSQYVYHTTRKFRDTSAWYHIVVRNDTTQSAALDRVRIYVNGVQETEFSTNYVASIVGQNHEFAIPGGDTTVTRIGSLGHKWHFSGYIAEVNVVSTESLGPESFGQVDEDSGIWIPKQYTGSYNTNGFRLNFSDSSNLGINKGGTGNFSLNNMSAIDQASDSPTNNFATMNVNNPLGVYSEGATKVTSPVVPNIPWATSSIAINHGGKWYCELKLISASNSSGGNHWQNGITPHQYSTSWNYTIMYRSDGLVLNLPTTGNTSGNASFAANDIMGMAYDSSNRSLKFYKNGSLVLTKTVDVASNVGDYFFGAGATNGGTHTSNWNFGGYTASAISSGNSDADGYGNFEYAVPSGYYALCTKNLAKYGG